MERTKERKTINTLKKGRNREHTLQKANQAWMRNEISTQEYITIIKRHTKENNKHYRHKTKTKLPQETKIKTYTSTTLKPNNI